MKRLLTPKQVARAIEVSESSVKRWCDKGTISTQYTVGGHRRIPLSGFIDFLRTTKHELMRPEIVGLPATVGQTDRVLTRARDEFVAALVEGDEECCRRIIIDMYLAKHGLARICDSVMATAFERIGNLWACAEAEVFQERRACEVTLRILRELRTFLTPPPAGGPLAIGGAAAGDHYSLATSMVELALRESNWNAVSLGDNLPFETLAAAIRENRPRLFWLSVSHVEDHGRFLFEYNQLYEAHGLDVAFAVGGRALTPAIRSEMEYAAYCDNLRHLEGFASSLASPSPESGEA